MIITRTPYRISFFGGGTDYPGWFRDHGGAVVATTINRYCYLTCRFLPPFFEHKSRIVWSQIERVMEHSEIEHPAIRGVLETMNITQGVEIHHNGDLPARSGLGSSSAFTVGLLHGLHALRGHMVSKRDLAREAIHIERDVLNENVGVQDQIQTAFGGLNRIDISPDGGFEVRPIIVTPQRLNELQSRFLLFYTGVVRNASDVAADQVTKIPDKTRELTTMSQMVDEGVNILSSSCDIGDFGKLLHEGWELKRSLSDKIAPPFVNEIYDVARAAGADGGKLLGAGGGGFMLFSVPPQRRQDVLDALSRLLLVPFECERTGTQLIYYEPESHTQTALSAERDYVRYGTDRLEPKKRLPSQPTSLKHDLSQK